MGASESTSAGNGSDFENSYVGASLAAAGPFFEIDVNQTDASGIQPTNGWPLFDSRISFSTFSGFWDVQLNGSGTNYPWLQQYGKYSRKPLSGVDSYAVASEAHLRLKNFQRSERLLTPRSSRLGEFHKRDPSSNRNHLCLRGRLPRCHSQQYDNLKLCFKTLIQNRCG